MEQIFCFESEFIVPVIILMDGKLYHPFRIYSNLDGTICTVIGESPIMIDAMHSVLDAIATRAEDVGIDDVFVIDRISIRPGSSKTVTLRVYPLSITSCFFIK
jgi:uncharacterized protein